MATHLGRTTFHTSSRNLSKVVSNIVQNLSSPSQNWGADPAVLVVGKDSDFNTLQDVIDFTKANPGKFDNFWRWSVCWTPYCRAPNGKKRAI